MKALILTGGKSTRMGTDKASLKIGGVTQLDRILSLIRPLTQKIYLSIAHPSLNQSGCDIQRSAHDLRPLADLEPSPGPLGGLQAAFNDDPRSPWLIIACDLPRLGLSDLKELMDHHDSQKDVTCFLNPLDNQPEPLCAIYSPSASAKLDKVIAVNQRCARRFLTSLDRIELTPSDPQAFLNMNRPEQLAELEYLDQYGAVEKTITVEYFAKLSEEAGTESEDLRTSAATLAGLWDEVRLKHHFTLDLPHVKPALNNEFASWDTPLANEQTIAFMPPFAGG